MLDSQLSYLKAMGIDVWVRRELPALDDLSPVVADTVQPVLNAESRQQANPIPVAAISSEVPEVPAEPDVAMPSHVLEEAPPEDAPGYLQEVESLAAELPPSSGVNELDWPELQQRVAACSLCELHRSRTQTVFGVGNQHADILIIGEAPGADEDRQGEPFVGKAGQLLNAMLKAIDLSREQVYIANILKCRPPNNRDPKPEEAELCSAYLYRQIQLIQPTLILALGRIAAQRLLQSSSPLGRMRNQIHRLPSTETPVIVTYHPAYLLRSPAEKRKAWEDLCSARTFVHNVRAKEKDA